jgi:hypothetical protein
MTPASGAKSYPSKLQRERASIAFLQDGTAFLLTVLALHAP